MSTSDPKPSRRTCGYYPCSAIASPFRFYKHEFEETCGRFSPNGRWMAYTSNETGRDEVYVQSFPTSGAKWLVSTNGGGWPRWRRDGKELFYLASDGKLMAVSVNGEGTFKAGVPKALFQTREIVGRYPVCRDARWPTLSGQYAARRGQHRADHRCAQLDCRTQAINLAASHPVE